MEIGPDFSPWVVPDKCHENFKVSQTWREAPFTFKLLARSNAAPLLKRTSPHRFSLSIHHRLSDAC